MIPNIKKGSYMRDLLVYLAGEGKANEHHNQRVIAGDVVTQAVFGGRITTAQAAEMARLLDSPRQTVLRGEPVLTTDRGKARALIAQGMDRREALAAATRDVNTWHCSLSLNPTEGQLSDETWAAIAHDFMREMGYAHREDEVPDVRWGAFHHGLNEGGGDHIHIAMGVVRPDGSIADLFEDYTRAQKACNVLEHRYGLEVLASREEGGAERATTPAERARKEREGAPETDREAMQRRVRALAVAASSEAEWVREMRAAGIMPRAYYEKGSRESVTGYSVEWRPDRGADGRREKTLTFSGLRLGKDMTLPQLRRWAGWDQSPEAAAEALAEWNKATDSRGRPQISSPLDEQQAIAELAQWSAYMRTIPIGDRAAWAEAAGRTSGLFAAASAATEYAPGPLDRLSRRLAAASELDAHKRPERPIHDTQIKAVARMLWIKKGQSAADMALIYALMDCLLAVRDMMAATDRARTAVKASDAARQTLAEIHMRADGIDPTKPYITEKGSPPWLAQTQAAVVVDGLDSAAAQADMREAYAAWDARRLASMEVLPYNERGQIIERTPSATRPVPAKQRDRKLSPTQEAALRQARTPKRPGREPDRGHGR
ncbi:relaxase/mobilization nuclease domain-containing protein [Nocardia rhamnosiphila]|uniref:relaxase/mobilization nuclease domain-containing protein n=1 Tax=Nocardia rhamnosiphila TaxID=426716 RepID=UPI0033F89454